MPGTSSEDPFFAFAPGSAVMCAEDTTAAAAAAVDAMSFLGADPEPCGPVD